MKINVIAVGKRQPAWVETAVADYCKRLHAYCRFQLHIVESVKPINAQYNKTHIDKEGQRLLNLVADDERLIALDEQGEKWSTKQLANNLTHWQRLAQPISLIIGGADGLSAACKKRAQQLWSLSALTLPHGLARILVVEQLYRAFSLLHGHPYHRE